MAHASKGTRQEQASEKQYRKERAIAAAKIAQERRAAEERQMQFNLVVEQNRLTDLQRQKERLAFTQVPRVAGSTEIKGTDALK